tara:strand:+ start:477 stop:674 length:198 start_codon:yes stop_codon:yes gene_type:complete
MEDIIDLIATDASASEVSDKIKDLLYQKSAERLELARPLVASSVFGDEELDQPDEQSIEEPTEQE